MKPQTILYLSAALLPGGCSTNFLEYAVFIYGFPSVLTALNVLGFVSLIFFSRLAYLSFKGEKPVKVGLHIIFNGLAVCAQCRPLGPQERRWPSMARVGGLWH